MSTNDAYPLQPFRIRNNDTLCEVMRCYPLATLITGAAGQCRLTLVPLLVDAGEDGQIVLSGHIDRNNDQIESLQPGARLSFHFVGPDSYASPDLYANPHLPGWLYISVQGDGEICGVLDEPQLRTLLIRSTETFGSRDQRFKLDRADPRFDLYLKYIHGIKIKVTRISGIAKLAQDKGPVDSKIATTYLAGRNNNVSTPLFEKLLTETIKRSRPAKL